MILDIHSMASKFIGAWVEVKIVQTIRELSKRLTVEQLAGIIKIDVSLPELLLPLMSSNMQEQIRYAKMAHGILETFGVDKLLSLVEEANPQYAQVLRDNPQWVEKQVQLISDKLSQIISANLT